MDERGLFPCRGSVDKLKRAVYRALCRPRPGADQALAEDVGAYVDGWSETRFDAEDISHYGHKYYGGHDDDDNDNDDDEYFVADDDAGDVVRHEAVSAEFRVGEVTAEVGTRVRVERGGEGRVSQACHTYLSYSSKTYMITLLYPC